MIPSDAQAIRKPIQNRAWLAEGSVLLQLLRSRCFTKDALITKNCSLEARFNFKAYYPSLFRNPKGSFSNSFPIPNLATGFNTGSETSGSKPDSALSTNVPVSSFQSINWSRDRFLTNLQVRWNFQLERVIIRDDSQISFTGFLWLKFSSLEAQRWPERSWENQNCHFYFKVYGGSAAGASRGQTTVLFALTTGDNSWHQPGRSLH